METLNKYWPAYIENAALSEDRELRSLESKYESAFEDCAKRGIHFALFQYSPSRRYCWQRGRVVKSNAAKRKSGRLPISATSCTGLCSHHSIDMYKELMTRFKPDSRRFSGNALSGQVLSVTLAPFPRRDYNDTNITDRVQRTGPDHPDKDSAGSMSGNAARITAICASCKRSGW